MMNVDDANEGHERVVDGASCKQVGERLMKTLGTFSLFGTRNDVRSNDVTTERTKVFICLRIRLVVDLSIFITSICNVHDRITLKSLF